MGKELRFLEHMWFNIYFILFGYPERDEVIKCTTEILDYFLKGERFEVNYKLQVNRLLRSHKIKKDVRKEILREYRFFYYWKKRFKSKNMIVGTEQQMNELKLIVDKFRKRV